MAKCKRCGRGGLFRKVDSTTTLCKECTEIEELEKQKGELSKSISTLSSVLSDKRKLYDDIAAEAKQEILDNAENILSDTQEKISAASRKVQILTDNEASLLAQIETAEQSIASVNKDIERQEKRLEKFKYAYKQIKHYFDYYEAIDIPETHPDQNPAIRDFLAPVVELHLQNMNVRDLRKQFKKNEKAIHQLQEKYESRYTTKANQTIYRLMVIALSAELQNILFDLKYNKLDVSIDRVKEVIAKYLKIAVDGSQVIAPTIKKFIGELESLYIEAVHIEYEYYVQKERIREEQQAIRDQMRQERQEQKELERQQKQLEKEREKFNQELSNLSAQIDVESDPEKVGHIAMRIEEVKSLLVEVDDRREQIVNLQHGKAGYVYVISNLGSFGDDVFKIGMTRRLEPLDRIRELGSASVPFPFDVHSLIFSEDAVGLEYSIHKSLHESRLNKVNLRKEFFRVTLDDLESLVYSLQPSAEFNTTLLALQYRQSLSIDEVPGEVSLDEEFDEDELEAELA